MAKNYYDVLGILKSASPDDIRRAYRKLAGEHHPDRGGSAEQFKEINEAYQVLSDPQKRTQYDKYGQAFEQAQGQGYGDGRGFGGNPFGGFDFSQGFGFGNSGVEFDLGDIFSDIFGGGSAANQQERRNRGVDLEMPMAISFREAAFGAEKEVVIEKKNACEHCGGSGAEPGTKITTCPKCHGSGNIKSTRRTILGTMSSSMVCDQCSGTGKVPENPCRECLGSGIRRGQKKVKIKIPAGINDQQRIRIKGEGEAGYRGSENGDLYILIRVQDDEELKREGFDLYKDTYISFAEAALGSTIETGTLDGTVKIKIPPGTQSGKVFRVGGKGIQHLNHHGRGDMFVTVHIHVPEKLTRRQKELLKELQKADKEE